MWQAQVLSELGELAGAAAAVDQLATIAAETKAMTAESALAVARAALRLARGDATGAAAAVDGLSGEFAFALLGRVTRAKALAALGKAAEAERAWIELGSWHKRDLLHAFLRAKLVAQAG